MKICEFILEGRDKLASARLQCQDALLHMKQIVSYGLGIEMSELYVRWQEELEDSASDRLNELVRRRMTGEPFQYLVGYEWFWNSRFHVGPGVLIPRRETELLVETFLRAERRSGAKVAELGAGCGNIGISIVLERANLEWHAFESNGESIPYLEMNQSELLSPKHAHRIYRGDFFTMAGSFSPYDWIISNPPYVASAEIPALAREIQYEPPVALDGGGNGLDVIARLIEVSRELLVPGGSLLFEFSSEQKTEINRLLQQQGFVDTVVLNDYASTPRACWVKKG